MFAKPKPQIPAMKKINSKSIKAAGHDGTDLYVQFHNGSTYRYPGVSADHVSKMSGAPSANAYLRANVMSKSTGTRVDK